MIAPNIAPRPQGRGAKWGGKSEHPRHGNVMMRAASLTATGHNYELGHTLPQQLQGRVRPLSSSETQGKSSSNARMERVTTNLKRLGGRNRDILVTYVLGYGDQR